MIQLQYAQLKFGWTAVELGNFLSFVGISRIVALLVVIPLLTKLWKKYYATAVSRVSSAEDLRMQGRANQDLKTQARYEGDCDNHGKGAGDYGR